MITRTKLVVPRRPANLLTRGRLVDLMLDLLEYRFILVTAPAGYGKTSLLIDFAHQADMPVCWYSLDALDQDPQCFLTHFIASIAERFPNFGKQAEAILSDPSATFDLNQLVRVIVNEAYEQIREHFVIVLDDYHLVTGAEAIDQFVSSFAQRVDENCHLFLASRTPLKLPDLELMTARSQMGGLASQELAFRADEIQSLMLQNYGLSLSDSEAEKLARYTEGWITGLLLSAQSIGQGMTDRVRLAQASGVGLYDYLAQQVLDRQPTPVRNFLLRTSLPEEFDADLCAAVLGTGENWNDLIETVLRGNLFVLPVNDGRTSLRYHPLFRDFLQTRLAREHPGERDRILRRLVTVYSGRGEWDRAHSACQHLGDSTLVADLIEHAGLLLVKSGRVTTLAHWIDELPPNLLASRPHLASLRGIAASMQGEVERGLSLQNQAEAAFRSAGDLSALARTLAHRAIDHRILGNYPASLADAEEALTLASRDEGLRDIQAEALRAKGTCLARMGQPNEAVTWLAQSLEVYDSLGDAARVAMLCMDLGLAHMIAGRYDQAFLLYHRAFDHWYKVNDLGRQANVLNNLGVLEHLQGYYERAAMLLEEAVDCARQSGSARIEALAVSSIGDLYADLDAVEAALDAYRQARDIAQRINYGFLLLHLDLAEASLSRRQGNLARARQLVGSAQRLTQASGSGPEKGLWHSEAGQLALAEGNAQDAMTHLEEAIHHFVEGGQRVEGARACLYLAAACKTSGDGQAALFHLRQAVHLAADLQSQHVLAVAGKQAKSLLEDARNDPEIGLEASRLLSQVLQFEQDVPTLRRQLRRRASAIPFMPPHLAFKTLGKAQVAVRGRPVTGAEWQAQVARHLLFCLLAHPDGLTRERLGIIFWPDKSPRQLKGQFDKTLYRLRRALEQEQDVVLFDQGQYHINRALDYEYDVDVFEEKLKQAKAAADTSERIAAYRAAMDLYEGAYLSELDEDWAVTERTRLQEAFLQAALALATLYLDARQYEAVIDCCQRALAQDRYLEEAYRLTMRAYAAMGNLVAVTRQFERCRQALTEDLDTPVSPQTKALYDSLMRQ